MSEKVAKLVKAELPNITTVDTPSLHRSVGGCTS
jgi:hypothetical protein